MELYCIVSIQCEGSTSTVLALYHNNIIIIIILFWEEEGFRSLLLRIGFLVVMYYTPLPSPSLTAGTTPARYGVVKYDIMARKGGRRKKCNSRGEKFRSRYQSTN